MKPRVIGNSSSRDSISSSSSGRPICLPAPGRRRYVKKLGTIQPLLYGDKQMCNDKRKQNWRPSVKSELNFKLAPMEKRSASIFLTSNCILLILLVMYFCKKTSHEHCSVLSASRQSTSSNYEAVSSRNR